MASRSLMSTMSRLIKAVNTTDQISSSSSSSPATVIQFYPSIAISITFFCVSLFFSLTLARKLSYADLKKRSVALLIQALVMLSHALAIGCLIVFMNSQDVGLDNVLAWTLSDCAGIVDTIIGLLLILMDIRILRLFLPILDDHVLALKRVNILQRVLVLIWGAAAVPYFVNQILWSDDQSIIMPWLVDISNYGSILSILSYTLYESLQSVFILSLMFSPRLSGKHKSAAMLAEIKWAGILILLSLSAEFSGEIFYVVGLYVADRATSVPLYCLVFCCVGIHTITIQLTIMQFITIFQQGRKEERTIAGLTSMKATVTVT